MLTEKQRLYLMSEANRSKLLAHSFPKGVLSSLKPFVKGQKAWNEGKTWSAEVRQKIGLGNKGKQCKGMYPKSAEQRQKLSEAAKGKPLAIRWRNPEAVECQKEWMRQLGLQQKGKRKPWLSQRNKEPEWTKKRLRGLNYHPNKYEKQVMQAIQEYQLPYRFTGDGAVILDNLAPDFVSVGDGRNIIEVFGDCFHKPGAWKPIPSGSLEEVRRERFAEVGFRMLVLWVSELQHMSNADIAQRIIDFEKGGNSGD